MYCKVSPLMFASKIKAPMVLIHGGAKQSRHISYRVRPQAPRNERKWRVPALANPAGRRHGYSARESTCLPKCCRGYIREEQRSPRHARSHLEGTAVTDPAISRNRRQERLGHSTARAPNYAAPATGQRATDGIQSASNNSRLLLRERSRPRPTSRHRVWQ